MRFSTFLLLFLFLLFLKPQATAQNLIYDWSVEEYVECPYLLTLEMFVPHWKNFRANPDYLNTCSPNLGPLTNPFGWQHPKTGEGLIGVVTFSPGLANAREYPGVELIEPMIIGQSYEISYYVATSYSENPWLTGRATNNLGALLMTDNYLSNEELGPIPNFAHLNVDSVVLDTAEWVKIKGVVQADSSYKYVAFGNFFDDINTVDTLLNGREGTVISYYYFDDFCVVPEGGNCMQVLSTPITKESVELKVYPNPADHTIFVSSTSKVMSVKALTMFGEVIYLQGSSQNSSDSAEIPTMSLTSGMYILIIETEDGVAREKIVIQH